MQTYEFDSQSEGTFIDYKELLTYLESELTYYENPPMYCGKSLYDDYYIRADTIKDIIAHIKWGNQ